MDWELIKVSGKNGILSVVTTLFCWGVCVEDAPDSLEHIDWSSAVADVAWAFEKMLRAPQVDEEPPSQPAKGRKR